MFHRSGLGLIKHLDSDRIACIHQRRKTNQRLRSLADLQQLGQFTKSPVGEALVYDGRSPSGRGRGIRAGGLGLRRASYWLRLVRHWHCGRSGDASALPQLQRRQRLKRPTRLFAPLGFECAQIAALPQLAAMLIHHLEVHEKVRAQHVGLDVGTHDVQRCRLANQLEHRVHQTARTKALVAQACGHLRRRLGQRNQARARPLVQSFQQGLDLVFQHTRHQPFAALVVHLVQHKQRYGHRHPVQRVTRRVQVAGRAVHAAQADGLGEHRGGDACSLVPHQLFAGQQQELRLLFQLFAVPALATETAAHIGGQLLIVKGVNQLLVHQHILAARLVFQVFHLFDQLQVGGQKRQRAVPLAGHQRLADKHLARTGHVNPPVVHPPPAVNHDAVERGALQRHHFGRLLFPMRIE